MFYSLSRTKYELVDCIMELAMDPKGSFMLSRGFRRETFVVENCFPERETAGKALYRLKHLPLKVSRDTAYRVYPLFNHHTSSWSYTNTRAAGFFSLKLVAHLYSFADTSASRFIFVRIVALAFRQQSFDQYKIK